MLETIKFLLAPRFCYVCGVPGEYLCNRCRRLLIQNEFDECIVCGNLTTKSQTHKICLKHDNFLPIAHIYPFIYKGLVKDLINEAKNETGAYKLLDVLLKDQHSLNLLDQLEQKLDLVVSAPMTKKLFSTRLINHSDYIGQFIAKRLSTKFIAPFLKLKTTSQKSLTKENRHKLSDSFELINSEIDNIKSKRLLVVDDVSTSGNTLIYLTKLLYSNGADQVLTYSLCKDLLYN